MSASAVSRMCVVVMAVSTAPALKTHRPGSFRAHSSRVPTVTLPAERTALIEVQGMTKRYGEKVAVDDGTLAGQPGRVTGFLGPNGAGKSTTMRVILGLDAPTTGSATVAGRAYRDLP